eukprot:TRINITY_DN47925_c0_g1_i2.p1 TRINITY_DN47925_c0_g1~~TRINITY_DN47925_c0_g1_i2.p1  ORF type:complete len:210 (+),score=14.08 TRINITY_DN47925_c0_g1_i2:60-689(+)
MRSEAAYNRYVWKIGRTIETFLRCVNGIPLWDSPETRSLFMAVSLLKKPTFIGWGQDDNVVPLGDSWDILREMFHDSPILVYRQCKHQLLVDSFPQSSRDIIFFLKGKRIPAIVGEPFSTKSNNHPTHYSAHTTSSTPPSGGELDNVVWLDHDNRRNLETPPQAPLQMSMHAASLPDLQNEQHHFSDQKQEGDGGTNRKRSNRSSKWNS